MQRYIKNHNTITPQENEKLGSCSVCVAGCGGLGGYIIEMLGRIGVGCITAVDGDVFEESNLNRQLLSDMDSLGKSKALCAKQRMSVVNPLIEVLPVVERVGRDNGIQILRGHDVIIDALDNPESKLLLQDFAEELNIPMIHGAIAGWYGQVAVIYPGDRTLDIIYAGKNKKGVEKELGNPPFTPANIAAIEVSETIKLLLGKDGLLRKKMLLINLLELEFNVVDLTSVNTPILL